jgi:DNA-directed RNA polymerase specialized sigma24 family protein
MGSDDAMTRRLTAEQQARAADALRLVPVAVRSFKSQHPSYHRLFAACDLTSVAQLAVVEASSTYDPAKSQPTTYYGSAIRHALLKEVRRVQRSRVSANERVHLDKALDMTASPDDRHRALTCLQQMTATDRALVEAVVIEGRSLMSVGRQEARDWRTIKSRLKSAVDRLAACVSEHSDGPEDSLAP